MAKEKSPEQKAKSKKVWKIVLALFLIVGGLGNLKTYPVLGLISAIVGVIILVSLFFKKKAPAAPVSKYTDTGVSPEMERYTMDLDAYLNESTEAETPPPPPDPKPDPEKEKREAYYKKLREDFAAALEAIPAVEITVSEKPAPKRLVSEVAEIPFSNITKKTPRDKLGNFVVFDTETTGLAASKAEIVEIAAIRFRDFKPVEKFVTLCRPRKGISEEAAKINGITADMVEGKPEFGCVAQALQDFFGTDNLVAHNLEFDLKFIVKGGVDVAGTKRKYYDTLEIAQRTLKRVKDKWDREFECYMPNYDADYDVEDYKLGTLCSYYGIPYYGSHRALADCYVTGQLLQKLAEDRE